MSISNSCKITFQGQDGSYDGNMVNISAGGYAFVCNSTDFADSLGRKISIMIEGFPVAQGRTLSGEITRVSNDKGRYFMGCRMEEDDLEIMKYIAQNVIE